MRATRTRTVQPCVTELSASVSAVPFPFMAPIVRVTVVWSPTPNQSKELRTVLPMVSMMWAPRAIDRLNRSLMADLAISISLWAARRQTSSPT